MIDTSNSAMNEKEGDEYDIKRSSRNTKQRTQSI